MKHQRRPFGHCNVRVRLYVDSLPGRKRCYGHLVKIVFGAPVREFATLVLFEKQRVNAVMHIAFFNDYRLIEPEHAHKRMQSFDAVIIVELLDGVEVYFLHSFLRFWIYDCFFHCCKFVIVYDYKDKRFFGINKYQYFGKCYQNLGNGKKVFSFYEIIAKFAQSIFQRKELWRNTSIQR